MLQRVDTFDTLKMDVFFWHALFVRVTRHTRVETRSGLKFDTFLRVRPPAHRTVPCALRLRRPASAGHGVFLVTVDWARALLARHRTARTALASKFPTLTRSTSRSPPAHPTRTGSRRARNCRTSCTTNSRWAALAVAQGSPAHKHRGREAGPAAQAADPTQPLRRWRRSEATRG